MNVLNYAVYAKMIQNYKEKGAYPVRDQNFQREYAEKHGEGTKPTLKSDRDYSKVLTHEV